MPLNCLHCKSPVSQQEIDAGVCDICGKPPRDAGPGVESAFRRGTGGPTAGEGGSARRESAPRPRAGGDAVLGWGTTRAALGLIAFATFIALILGVVGIILVVQDIKISEAENWLLVLGAAAIFAGAQVVSGIFMGTAVPEEAEARGWAIATCLCLIALFGVVVWIYVAAEQNHRALQRSFNAPFDPRVGFVQPTLPWTDEFFKVLRYVGQGLAISLGLCWGLYLRQVASSLRRPTLALGITFYVIVSLLLGIGTIVLQVVDLSAVPALANLMKGNEPYVVLGTWGLFELMTLWYLFLVLGVRRAVTSTLVG
jgi:hypothetical protein